MSEMSDAVENVVNHIQAADNFKLRQLVFQWPSMAVALHDLVVAQGERPPGILRHAAKVEEERKH